MSRSSHKKKSDAETDSLLPAPEGLRTHHLGEGSNLGACLRQWHQSGSPPQALLLTGAPGIGKRVIATTLAQAYLCEKFGPSHEESEPSFGLFVDQTPPHAALGSESLPCGACSHCLKALSGQWVDFQELFDPAGLKVDAFRDLFRSLGFSAHESRFRVVLLSDVDRMTPQAANALLKTLEEPPAAWRFLLTASDPALVLPTIRSRCQNVRLRPLSDALLLSLLEAKKVPEERRNLAVRLCEGSLGRALELSHEDSWELRRALVDFISRPAALLAPLLESTTQSPETLQNLVNQLESLLSDLIRWSVSDQNAKDFEWRNSDAATTLSSLVQWESMKHSKDQLREHWLGQAARLEAARFELSTPMNRKLLAQDLLLPWVART